MIGFNCGPGTPKDRKKSCMQCKHFFMFGISTGVCDRYKYEDERVYVSPQDHCKYYKRDSELFYSDGRIKDKELFEEMMYI